MKLTTKAGKNFFCQRQDDQRGKADEIHVNATFSKQFEFYYHLAKLEQIIPGNCVQSPLPGIIYYTLSAGKGIRSYI